MPIIREEVDFPRLSPEELEEWRSIPTPIIGDELNRCATMLGAIKPLRNDWHFAGQALTVECIVGDNGALHFALLDLWAGAVIVADGRGHEDTALWGEILHTCAEARGAAAVIIDGAIRDQNGIASSGLPMFARAICPRGPHKGWGGSINADIQCGGVAVRPGDLIVGDADGVAVIRLDQLDGLLERCHSRIKNEEQTLEKVSQGVPTVEVLGFPPIETIGT